MTNGFDLKKLPDEFLPDASDLPGDLRQVAGVVGVKKTLRLVDLFRGTQVYFRNLDVLLRKHRDESIRAAYDNGEKVDAIARRCALCSGSIKKILKKSGG